ncbi:3-oxoacyl-[acyl-carrier protein] reductase [Gracilibacillus ureilyticus]|uniref:3-oxoacyl-[acyl-carrier protein] reductase n=1 Tax=Gracilibacillus ureilyticus TaxID=531814 RepID=A0A1H9M4P2_9BACI|nr:SDR family oxidoreductase [Gracilibacillus ureilyticus]SER18670.1 3-oxoacyl-[acyl-carrier protein] reductase [Gracilibacillus ureilyticus]
MSLQDKVVVIIGASRGIGLATARLLKEHGAKLMLGARNIETIEQEFNDHQKHVCFYIDVTDEASVQKFTEKSLAAFGKIDVLLNSAGVGTFGELIESSTEDFDQMLQVNLRGTYLTCKYYGKVMVEQEDGQILNLSSIAGITPLQGNGGYTASKFGVHGLTKVLQLELRRKGVKVTSVLPGAVDSSFWDNIPLEMDKSSMIPVETVASQLLFLINQPKNVTIDEITIMPPRGIL